MTLTYFAPAKVSSSEGGNVVGDIGDIAIWDNSKDHVSVGENGEFSTIQEAIDYLSGFVVHPNSACEIRIEKGYIIREQTICHTDLGWCSIVCAFDEDDMIWGEPYLFVEIPRVEMEPYDVHAAGAYSGNTSHFKYYMIDALDINAAPKRACMIPVFIATNHAVFPTIKTGIISTTSDSNAANCLFFVDNHSKMMLDPSAYLPFDASLNCHGMYVVVARNNSTFHFGSHKYKPTYFDPDYPDYNYSVLVNSRAESSDVPIGAFLALADEHSYIDAQGIETRGGGEYGFIAMNDSGINAKEVLYDCRRFCVALNGSLVDMSHSYLGYNTYSWGNIYSGYEHAGSGIISIASRVILDGVSMDFSNKYMLEVRNGGLISAQTAVIQYDNPDKESDDHYKTSSIAIAPISQTKITDKGDVELFLSAQPLNTLTADGIIFA